jgi:transcriptional regulator with XRE-family HTH domain
MAKKILKSKVDLYIIAQVKKRREELNIHQDDIAIHLDVSPGFISHVESPGQRAKYNTAHLNELAKLFKCSPRDFMPEKPF